MTRSTHFIYDYMTSDFELDFIGLVVCRNMATLIKLAEYFKD